MVSSTAAGSPYPANPYAIAAAAQHAVVAPRVQGQPSADHGARERPDAQARDDQAQCDGRRYAEVVLPGAEREEQREEPVQRPEGGGRGERGGNRRTAEEPRRPAAAAEQPRHRLRGVGVHPGGEPQGDHHADQEDDRRGPQGPLGAEPGEQQPDRHDHRRGDGPGQRAAGVGRDQAEAGRQHAGDRRAAGDAVRPGHHQHPERGGVEQQRVHPVGDGERQERPRQHRGGQCVPPAVLEPVQHRAHHGRQQRERGHRDEQVQRDAGARLADRHVEEDRPGQAHRDQGVTGAGQGVEVDEPVHSALALAVGLPVPADPPAEAPADPAGERARLPQRRPQSVHAPIQDHSYAHRHTGVPA
jgi:hypothetical protein